LEKSTGRVWRGVRGSSTIFWVQSADSVKPCDSSEILSMLGLETVRTREGGQFGTQLARAPGPPGRSGCHPCTDSTSQTARDMDLASATLPHSAYSPPGKPFASIVTGPRHPGPHQQETVSPSNGSLRSNSRPHPPPIQAVQAAQPSQPRRDPAQHGAVSTRSLPLQHSSMGNSPAASQHHGSSMVGPSEPLVPLFWRVPKTEAPRFPCFHGPTAKGKITSCPTERGVGR
jgi:hypothetical protein